MADDVVLNSDFSDIKHLISSHTVPKAPIYSLSLLGSLLGSWTGMFLITENCCCQDHFNYWNIATNVDVIKLICHDICNRMSATMLYLFSPLIHVFIAIICTIHTQLLSTTRWQYYTTEYIIFLEYLLLKFKAILLFWDVDKSVLGEKNN